MRDLIVLIHIGHPNDWESARSMRQTFAKFGYRLEEVSVSDPESGRQLNALLGTRSAEIFCFISANYYALRVNDQSGALLHAFTGIPLVIMQHDHPLYFLDIQAPNLAGTITFAAGEGGQRFIEAYYPFKTQVIANTGSLPQIETEIPDFEQFKSRHNVILAPLNLSYGGNTLDKMWQHIKALPEPRRSFAVSLAEAALTDGVTPLHVLAENLANEMQPSPQIPVSDQLIALTFVKLWRRNQMIRALIDLPILISSEYVPADLEFMYPKKFTLFSTAETVSLYHQYRFTLNAHPLITHILHDRLLTATAVNSACITDVNAAVLKYFHDGIDAIFYDYSAIAEMPNRITQYLDDPAKAFDLTVRASAIRTASGYFGYRAGYDALIDAVAEHWAAEPRVPKDAFA